MSSKSSGPSRPQPNLSGFSGDLRFHGDAEAGDDLIDFAVNVRHLSPPPWLTAALAGSLAGLGGYPDQSAAVAAVADRHQRPCEEVLLTSGAAEAFVLLARALRPRRAVVVHPQFTEPEAALTAAGHRVDRVVLEPPFRLDPRLIPDDADLVVIGNPTNPTSVLHPATTLAALARPGRVLVIDEAFADCVPEEPESLATRRDLPGVVVIRSLTKTWALAGLRCGYLLGPADVLGQLRAVQPLWPVSTPALAAIEACSSAVAVREASQWALELRRQREWLVAALTGLGLDVVPEARASFVLLRHPRAAWLRGELRRRGLALRRGETFPGLSEQWLRIAVRDEATSDRLVSELAALLAESSDTAAVSLVDGAPMTEVRPVSGVRPVSAVRPVTGVRS